MKKNLIKIAAVVLGVVFIALLIFCIVKLNDQKNPKDSVKGFIDCLVEGNFEKAKTYTEEDTSDVLGLNEIGDSEEMVKMFFSKVEYKVIKVNKNGNQATIQVEITNKNIKTIMYNYMKKALELVMASIGKSDNNSSMENELLEYFKSQFETEDVEMVTNTVDVTLNKVDNEWKVVVDEKLRDGLLPGIKEASSLFTDSIG